MNPEADAVEAFNSLAVEKVVPNVDKGYREHLYITRCISGPFVFYNINFSAVKSSNS